LIDHEAFGCIAFWCVTKDRAHPFVFQRRSFKGFLPGVQVIYCQNAGDVSTFAPTLGFTLARKGIFLLRIDANAELGGLLGWYFDNMEPRYCRGGVPRLGDLAYTQAVLTKYTRRPHSMSS
jgi:hypothetical protein